MDGVYNVSPHHILCSFLLCGCVSKEKITQVLSRESSMRKIDRLILEWTQNKDTKLKIHEYIGLTLSEYDDFVNNDQIPGHLSSLAVEVDTRLR